MNEDDVLYFAVMIVLLAAIGGAAAIGTLTEHHPRIAAIAGTLLAVVVIGYATWGVMLIGAR